MPTFDQMLAQARQFASFAGGAAFSFGLISVKSQTDIEGDINHILNGVKEIAIGAGPLLAMAMAWWASHKASPTSQIAAVSAMPEVKSITVSDTTLATAAKQADNATEVKVPPNA